jgi:uncharacterized coiled-coil DUF342 family protein
MSIGMTTSTTSSTVMGQTAVLATVETDITVQSFARWLTEMKARNSRTLQEMLSEMSVIRDGITSNNVELTDFKRHSSGISQQMQSQLTDLREKLTNAFGEITSLVKQKTNSDQEMMQDINQLQSNLSCKSAEMENLKRNYSQAHQQLQNSLIQINNHMSVTKNEIANATASSERVQQDMSQRLGDIDSNLRGLEETLQIGNAENRNQMLQLQEEISRIHESLASVSAEFADHKRATNSVHNKLQSQVWSLEEGRKRYLQADSMLRGEFPPPSARATEVLPMVIDAPAAPTSILGQPQVIGTGQMSMGGTANLWAAASSATPLQSVTAPLANGMYAAGSMAATMTQPAGTAQAATATMRSALAPPEAVMSSTVLPTQRSTGTAVLQSMQSPVITPALPTRIMARPPVGIASPGPLR